MAGVWRLVPTSCKLPLCVGPRMKLRGLSYNMPDLTYGAMLCRISASKVSTPQFRISRFHHEKRGREVPLPKGHSPGGEKKNGGGGGAGFPVPLQQIEGALPVPQATDGPLPPVHCSISRTPLGKSKAGLKGNRYQARSPHFLRLPAYKRIHFGRRIQHFSMLVIWGFVLSHIGDAQHRLWCS